MFEFNLYMHFHHFYDKFKQKILTTWKTKLLQHQQWIAKVSKVFYTPSNTIAMKIKVVHRDRGLIGISTKIFINTSLHPSRSWKDYWLGGSTVQGDPWKGRQHGRCRRLYTSWQVMQLKIMGIYLVLSGFSVRNIHDSKDSSGSGRVYLTPHHHLHRHWHIDT